MEIEKVSKEGDITQVLYSDKSKASQYFIPKLWIKWRGQERIIKMKTFLGEKVLVTESDLRKLNLKLIKFYAGNRYVRVMEYNKPYRQSNRIPLLAISKKLQKRIGRLSINVEREYEQRAGRYQGWTGTKIT